MCLRAVPLYAERTMFHRRFCDRVNIIESRQGEGALTFLLER